MDLPFALLNKIRGSLNINKVYMNDLLHVYHTGQILLHLFSRVLFYFSFICYTSIANKTFLRNVNNIYFLLETECPHG